MKNLRLNTVWVLAKRELRSTIYGVGIYIAIIISLVISAAMLQDYLIGAERSQIIISTNPFSYPLSIATTVCAIYISIASVTSIAREKEMQTMEILFYGPVDYISYILSKYLKGVLSYIFIILFLAVYFAVAAIMSNLGLSPKSFGIFPLSLFLSSCLITFGIFISTLTESVRTSILLFLGIVVGMAAIQIFHGILIRVEDVNLISPLFYLRRTLFVIKAGVQWASPFYYLNKGIEAISLGSMREYILSIVFSIIYSATALLLSVLVLKKKGVRKIATSLILLFIAVCSAQAQTPVMEEQVVYGLSLFNGKGYTSSFCPRTEDTIYIIADSENVLLPKMTMVYYWPLKRRYQAGFSTLNETVDGTIEIIRNGKIIRELRRRTYTYYFAKGWYTGRSEILLDEKAKERYAIYCQELENYQKEYFDKQAEYLKQMDEFIVKLKEKGKPAARSYVQKPGEDYIVNLPFGRYKIRLRASDGTVVEGSEKNLISFRHRRSGKVGYEIIPEKRWTRPEISSDLTEIIYLEGKSTLYFRPYLQTEYPHLYYSKLLDPQNGGHQELYRWVNIEQIEKGSLQLVKKGQIMARIEERPYYIQQIPGAELGYTIVEYTEEKFPESGPSFVGYRVEIEPERNGRQIQLVDASGKVVPGSLRELRAIDAGKTRELYIASLILPLAVGVPILLWRRRKLK
jgi:ABC-type transport system involved in multi-copper enzyme maturation permease subunit